MSRVDGTFNYVLDGQNEGDILDYKGAKLLDNFESMADTTAQIFHGIIRSDTGTENTAYVYYDDLQDAYK